MCVVCFVLPAAVPVPIGSINGCGLHLDLGCGQSHISNTHHYIPIIEDLTTIETDT